MAVKGKGQVRFLGNTSRAKLSWVNGWPRELPSLLPPVKLQPHAGAELGFGTLMLYLYIAGRGHWKYTIPRRERFSEIKNRQGALKQGGVKCSPCPTKILMWLLCIPVCLLFTAVSVWKLKCTEGGELEQRHTHPHRHTHALLIVCYYQLISACPKAGRKQPTAGLGPPEVL